MYVHHVPYCKPCTACSAVFCKLDTDYNVCTKELHNYYASLDPDTIGVHHLSQQLQAQPPSTPPFSTACWGLARPAALASMSLLVSMTSSNSRVSPLPAWLGDQTGQHFTKTVVVRLFTTCPFLPTPPAVSTFPAFS